MKSLFLACAISLSSLNFKPPLTDGEQSLFRLLAEIKPEIAVIHKYKSTADFAPTVMRMEPGGFLFVRGEFKEIRDYFRNQGWEILPMFFREYHIYRKPFGGAA